MIAAVDDVLGEIGAGDRPRVLVLNKADALDADRRLELALRHPDGVLVSALTGEGLDELGARVEAEFAAGLRPLDLLVPYADSARLSELHALAGDLEREDTADGVRVHVRLPAAVAARYERFAVGGPAAGTRERT